MWNCECFYCGSDMQLTSEQVEARMQLANFRIVCQDCIAQLCIAQLEELKHEGSDDEQGCIPEEDLEPRDPQDKFMSVGQHLHDVDNIR